MHWLLPSGEVRKARPQSFGVIGNGHLIKLGHEDKPSPVDQNYESEFQRADDAFPSLISWLDGLDRAGPPFEAARHSRIIPQSVTDEQMATLVKCIVSLAVRGPMHRERAVAVAEHLRGPLPERERNTLIGLNMRYSYRDAIKRLRGRGKAMVIYSPERELIFGDGFFHNILPPTPHVLNPKILAPVTPWLGILYTQPMKYRVDPKLVTLTINAEEADALNLAVQVYAKDHLFFRSEKPTMIDAYAQDKHLLFADDRNAVDTLIYEIPGVGPRDTSLDFLRS